MGSRFMIAAINEYVELYLYRASSLGCFPVDSVNQLQICCHFFGVINLENSLC